MSGLTITALLGSAVSLVVRRRRRSGRLELDDLVIALTLHVGCVGLLAIVLAWAGWFGPITLGIGGLLLGVAAWPWALARASGPRFARPAALTLGLSLVVAGGVALRVPVIHAPLAGRDQGTYVLRAQATLRTGALGWTDPLLARAGAELAEHPRPGSFDLLGLYPIGDEPWRRDRYDGAYRPGTYLGDREAGEVVPQFFHLHPMLLAVSGAALGPDRVQWISPYLAALWLACLACVARRLWPGTAWPLLAVAVVAGSPLAIWVARTPLSETAMALFEWTAVLLALREADRREPWLIAACLAAAALTRGNAVIVLPVVLALAWLRARPQGAAYGVLAGLLASVIIHALTTYPYMHDELLRQLPGVEVGPLGLIGLATLAAAGWIAVDLAFARVPEHLRAKLLARAPQVFALACAGAAVLWWTLRERAPAGRPFSRLDAAPILLGTPLLLVGVIGVLLVVLRWRPKLEQVWLVALLGVLPVTMLLYALRQLPTLAFFYYGRYLVPELLPVAALAATAALALATGWLAGHATLRARVAKLIGGLASLGLLGSVVWPLIEHPQLRLREYEPADEAVTWLASQLPDDAVVIAGGEGWHHGHTYNQIGGALALREGVEVLPYRTREDAWISAWELLVEAGVATGEPAPPLFLLVNEAAHHYNREGRERVAMLDDQLWAPFRVERADLLELFLHALTPVADQLPTRVARHELRMGLLRLRVDEALLGEIASFALGDPRVRVSGGLGDGCLAIDRPLRIELPRPAGAAHLVIVAEPANEPMSRRVGAWQLEIDGVDVGIEPPPGLPPRPRATIGPVPLPLAHPDGPIIVELTGVDLPPAARGPAACPFGRVATIRVLPRERGGVFELDAAHLQTKVIAPREDLGPVIEPSTWVRGRAVSRYRPGTTPTPTMAGLALRVDANASLTFAPIDLPLDTHARPQPLDLLVTLANTRTEAPARLHVFAGSEPIASIDVPPLRDGSWISTPVAWQPAHDRTQLRVELEAASGHVELRDIALFVR